MVWDVATVKQLYALEVDELKDARNLGYHVSKEKMQVGVHVRVCARLIDGLQSASHPRPCSSWALAFFPVWLEASPKGYLLTPLGSRLSWAV